MWIVKWETESGDSGIHGYWKDRPDHFKLKKKYMKERHQDDYPDYLDWELIELREIL